MKKVLIIPHLPHTNTRGFQIAKNRNTYAETHFVTWSMPFPFELSKLINGFKYSWRYSYSIVENVHVHNIPRFPFFAPLINKAIFKFYINKIFHKYKLDLILSESYFSETEPPLNLPLIYDYVDDHEAFKDVYGSLLYKFAFKVLAVRRTMHNQITTAKAVVVVSNHLRDKVLDREKRDSLILPNGVEESAFEIPLKTGKKNSIIYTTYFGQWSQLNELIDAVVVLKSRIPDITLTLVGDGIEYENINKRVQNDNLTKFIRLTGRISDSNKLHELINEHEICVNLSEKNSFRNSASPMKVFVYSALGKKIISTDLDEVKRLRLPNLYLVHSSSELTTAITKALNSEVNSIEIRHSIEIYKWHNILKQLESLIEENV